MDGENNGSKPYEQMDDLGDSQPPNFLVQHPYKGWTTTQLYFRNILSHYKEPVINQPV